MATVRITREKQTVAPYKDTVKVITPGFEVKKDGWNWLVKDQFGTKWQKPLKKTQVGYYNTRRYSRTTEDWEI